jgi:hypothetical protein
MVQPCVSECTIPPWHLLTLISSLHCIPIAVCFVAMHLFMSQQLAQLVMFTHPQLSVCPLILIPVGLLTQMCMLPPSVNGIITYYTTRTAMSISSQCISLHGKHCPSRCPQQEPRSGHSVIDYHLPFKNQLISVRIARLVMHLSITSTRTYCWGTKPTTVYWQKYCSCIFHLLDPMINLM